MLCNENRRQHGVSSFSSCFILCSQFDGDSCYSLKSSQRSIEMTNRITRFFLLALICISFGLAPRLSRANTTLLAGHQVAPEAISLDATGFGEGISFPINTPVYNSNGTIASSTVHITGVNGSIYYLADTSLAATYIFDPLSTGHFYFVVRVTFDSSAWKTINGGGVGFQWINGEITPNRIIDSLAGPATDWKSLAAVPHPTAVATVNYMWFPLTLGKTGLLNPVGDHSNIDYTLTNTAYYIFDVSNSDATPFNISPYKSDNYTYGPGVWGIANPSNTNEFVYPAPQYPFTLYQW